MNGKAEKPGLAAARTLIVAVAIPLWLLGCGGGGGSGQGPEPVPAALTGAFQPGNVAGLRYRTATRQGLTDAGGRFQYLPGEAVTFSVGNVDLGSAPGAAVITPFTLAGSVAPTTELALRRELSRARDFASPFVHAANLSRFLLAMDADGIPANGIDLTQRHDVLANSTLSFNQPASTFAWQLDRLAPDQNRNIPIWQPMVYLYRSLNIAVPVHATARRLQTGGPFPGFGTTETTSTYAASGLLESWANSTDGSILPSPREVEYSYDTLGRDLGTRQRMTWTGLLTPVQEYLAITTITYDAYGNAQRRLVESDNLADGSVEARSAVNSTFDSFGRELNATVTEELVPLDERVRSTFAFTYDTRGNLLVVLDVSDMDGDGIADQITTVTHTYDGNDRIQSTVSESDDGADGTIDTRETISLTHSPDGRTVGQVWLYDADGNGVADYAVTTTWTYNADGSLAEWTTEGDSDNDGSPNYRENIIQTFDSEGRLVLSVQNVDTQADGVFEIVSRLQTGYDTANNVVSRLSEGDLDADGIIDTRVVEAALFGAGGEPLESRHDTDSNADGSTDYSLMVEYTNMVMSDGIATLAQQYLGPPISIIGGVALN